MLMRYHPRSGLQCFHRDGQRNLIAYMGCVFTHVEIAALDLARGIGPTRILLQNGIRHTLEGIDLQCNWLGNALES